MSKMTHGGTSKENGATSVILIKQGSKRHLLHVSDILYAMISNVTLTITLKDKNCISTRMSMSRFESMIPEHLFIKPHGSFIVSIAHVVSYTDDAVKMANGKEIEISRNRLKRFEEGIKHYLLENMPL